jgi:hypothetical protein
MSEPELTHFHATVGNEAKRDQLAVSMLELDIQYAS